MVALSSARRRSVVDFMMATLEYALFAAGFYPLYCAWVATRGASLFAAVHWGIAAWVAWGVMLADVAPGHPNPATFTALCLTGCAGVAVLGARRPQVVAWNFVVLGLLAAMLLPLVEMALLRAHTLDGIRIGFLAVTLGIGIVNYLPTRFGPAAFLLGLGCAGELIGVLADQPLPGGGEEHLIRLCWLAAPWLAWALGAPTGAQQDELDSLWRSFRDRWGLVWGQRVREQFNRAAVNARWPVILGWSGFKFQQPADAATRAAACDTLLALLQRFVEAPRAKK